MTNKESLLANVKNFSPEKNFDIGRKSMFLQGFHQNETLKNLTKLGHTRLFKDTHSYENLHDDHVFTKIDKEWG